MSESTFHLKNDFNGCRLQALRGSARHGTMAGLCSVARGGGLGFGACERDCVRLRPPVLRARQHPLSSERLQNHHKILQHSSIGHGEVAVTRFPALQHGCGVRKPTFHANFRRARNAMASAEDFLSRFAQNAVGLDMTTWRILERQIGLMQSSRWLGSTEKGRRSVSAARTANPHSGWASGVRRVWAWVVVGGGRVAGLARAAHTSPIIIYT